MGSIFRPIFLFQNVTTKQQKVLLHKTVKIMAALNKTHFNSFHYQHFFCCCSFFTYFLKVFFSPIIRGKEAAKVTSALRRLCTKLTACFKMKVRVKFPLKEPNSKLMNLNYLLNIESRQIVDAVYTARKTKASRQQTNKKV